MPRVITYNLSDNFIGKLADYLDENYLRCAPKAKDIARLAFVFGGKRPAFFLKKELARRIKKSFIPPRFFSIEEFVDYVLSKKETPAYISDLDACYLIYSLAREIAPGILNEKEAFSQFLPWVREIIAFIEQLDLEDIASDSLKNIQHKAVIGFDVPDNINVLLQSIIALRDAYHARLKESGIYSRGLRYLTASQAIKGACFDEFEQIFFCGFFYLHKTERAIIETLYQANKATLVFQGDAREWSVLEELARFFSCSLEPEGGTPAGCKLSLQAGFDTHSQACLVREALKETKNHKNTLIVLANQDNLIPLLSEISSQLTEYNVSMGYPLKRSSLYSLFECIFKAQGTKKGNAYYAKDYLGVLTHPLIKNLKIFKDPSLARILVHKIEEVLAGTEEAPLAGSIFVSPEALEHERLLFDAAMQTVKGMGQEVSYDELRQGLNQLHRILFFSWEPVDTLGGLSSALQGLLIVLVEKSFLASYPLNLTMAEKLFSVQEELARASFNTERFPQKELFKIFKNKLENEMISFSGSPLKGLQILGLFEARSLNFENVIMMDVNESILPNLKIYEPLIPREVMITLGLNRLEKEEEIQRYQFRRLISSAKNALLIFQESPEKEKSRFIEELIWEKQKSLKKLEVFSILKASFKVEVLPKKTQLSKTPEVIAHLKRHTYSASSLNSYLHCPLRFYYEYVLGLEEKSSVFEEPESRDIGTFVHELLKEEFGRFLGTMPRIDAHFEKEFFRALDIKFSREFARKMKSDSFLTQEVIKFRMQRFLENEKRRNVKKILCLEETFKGVLGEIKFKAIIDRIDILRDGEELVVDYKTGGGDLLPESDPQRIEGAGFTRKALKDTIKSFQLPLYLYLVQQDARYQGHTLNAALYFFKDFKQDYGMSRLFGDEDPGQKEKLMSLYLLGIEALYSEIIDPDVTFKADEAESHRCAYCPFFYLCR